MMIMTARSVQHRIDDANQEFWNELCGTIMAKRLGVVDHSAESLRRFDEAYLKLYPYLLKRVTVGSFNGLRVLEVGLGYGTLGQKIAESCNEYHGLDIAEGPVAMMNHRLNMMGLKELATQGSILDCSFDDASFDAVVSIGCFHHTGNIQQCIEETFRVLKPGGRAYVMVYNKFSYRNWMRWPLATFRASISYGSERGTSVQRAAYDPDFHGRAAPETVFSSVAELHDMFAKFSSFEARKENWGPRVPRSLFLNTVAHICGLDIYVCAQK